MADLIIRMGIIALIAKIIIDDSHEEKKVFISFSIKDEKYRNYLVEQSVHKSSPFDFIDMSLTEALPKHTWKNECRKRIRNCNVVIVLLSKNTLNSEGTKWEIKCAQEEGIPLFGMHIQKNNKSPIPLELKGVEIIDWTWDNLECIIDSY